jgi:hypothetical protein
MKRFDVQGIELNVSRGQAFAFVADPSRLPLWTSAFAAATNGRAVMRTPEGEVEIELQVSASPGAGTVDWRLIFPGGSVASAYSRIVELQPGSCAFTFILTPPPVPLERLEGALEAQSRTLADELERLKRILERRG